MEKTVQKAILENLREFSTPARPVYLVGGAVRDQLLNRPVHDLDFVLPGETRRLADELACRMNGALYMLDAERDTTRVVLNLEDGSRLMVDFASLRGTDLESDLRGRDFTINAMAFDVAHPERLIDPTGGFADVRKKVIRASAEDSIFSDPVRILRGIRQALGFHFSIDPQTFRLMREAAPRLPLISAERLRDELFRMLDASQVALAVRLLDQAGALRYFLPELERLKGVAQGPPHLLDAWEHTLSVVQHLEQLMAVLVGGYQEEMVTDLNAGSAVLWLGRFREQFARHYRERLVPDRSPRALLFLAALYHDISKPETRTVSPDGRVRFLGHDTAGAKEMARRARALALSLAEIQRLEAIVEYHMRIHHMVNARLAEGGEKPSRRSIYRFFRDAGEAGVDLCLLSLADTRGTHGYSLPQRFWEAELETCRALLEAFWEKSEEIVAPIRLLSGKDLIDIFGLAPGRIIGRLLDAVREAQAAGEVHDREDALSFARHWLAQNAAAENNIGEEEKG